MYRYTLIFIYILFKNAAELQKGIEKYSASLKGNVFQTTKMSTNLQI